MAYRPGIQRTSLAYGGVPEAQAYGRVSNVRNNPKLSGTFDGETVSIYNNGELEGKFSAQSGANGYQYKSATDIPNAGPIPEGQWLLKYKDFKTDNSPYNPKIHDHWGRERVAITPVSGNTYGRGNFYLHGSYNGLGSVGCIDLGNQMPQFGGIMKKYEQDIPLEIKYNKDSFQEHQSPAQLSVWERLKNKFGF